MAYRYLRSQSPLFNRKLPVPESVREQVFDGKLTLRNLLWYNLQNMVPLDRLNKTDMALVQKFGLEKFRGFDFDFYDKLQNRAGDGGATQAQNGNGTNGDESVDSGTAQTQNESSTNNGGTETAQTQNESSANNGGTETAQTQNRNVAADIMGKIDPHTGNLNKDMYETFLKQEFRQAKKEGRKIEPGHFDDMATVKFSVTFPHKYDRWKIDYVDMLKFQVDEMSRDEIIAGWDALEKFGYLEEKFASAFAPIKDENPHLYEMLMESKNVSVYNAIKRDGLSCKKLEKIEANDPELFAMFLKTNGTVRVDDLQNANGIKKCMKEFFTKFKKTTNLEYETALQYVELVDVKPDIFDVDGYRRAIESNDTRSIAGHRAEIERRNDMFAAIDNKITKLPFDLCDMNYSVMRTLKILGVGNIVEFERENSGGFFADAKTLDDIYDGYFHYGHPLRKDRIDARGGRWDEPCTKAEMYQTLRNCFVWGPTNGEFIGNGIDYRKISGPFSEQNQDLFLNKFLPEELKDRFYKHDLKYTVIKENPQWVGLLRGKELSQCCRGANQNYYEILMEKTGGDYDRTMDLIIKYADGLKADRNAPEYYGNTEIDTAIKEEDDIDTAEMKMVQRLRNAIVSKGISYSENMPEKFKETYPEMFLSNDVPQKIRAAFYKRELTTDDFRKNKDLLQQFGKTDILWGLPCADYLWVSKIDGLSNAQKLKIISNYEKITNENLKFSFWHGLTDLVKKGGDIDTIIGKTDILAELFLRLSNSNSGEIQNFSSEIAGQLITADDPIKTFDKVESVFVRNNLPTVGKLFNVFLLLHPDCMADEIDHSSRISPMLKACTALNHRKTIIGSDLLKCAFGSNNRSLLSYLDNLEKGNELFMREIAGGFPPAGLSANDKKILNTYKSHLDTLAKYSKNGIDMSDPTQLPDKIVRMFCGFAGFNTLKQAKDYITQKTNKADTENRKHAEDGITIAEGDLVKGIGGPEYLTDIFQNGSVAKEYLGAAAVSDTTPLDTDLSKILTMRNNIDDLINTTISRAFGPIYMLLKND
ncbi:MAG: hypothetical protein LBQ05_02735, partial [Christensenellaceae bacterium]|nr:hypothetical protein [Christensenellaceae bacterium]